MAANMKAVKLRIKSVESTMQITKAMELVASSKLPIDTINNSSAISSFLNLKNTGSVISTKARERSSSLYGLSPQNSPTIMQIKGRNPSQSTGILHRPSKSFR